MANGKNRAFEPRISGSWSTARSIGVSPKLHQELKTTLHRELLNRIDLEKLTSLEDIKARVQVQDVIHELVGKLDTPLSASERDRLSREVLHEVFGLGPLGASAAGPDHQRHFGQHAPQCLCRARRSAGADQGDLQGRGAPAAHHRQDCVQRGPTCG